MVRIWKDLTADQQEAIGHEFASLEAIRFYTTYEPSVLRKADVTRPTTQELVLFLQGEGNLSSEVILPLLRRDAVLKQKFEWLLSNYSLVSVTSAAAAASNEAIFERPLPDEGWVRIVRSNANSQQAHLVIQLPIILQDKEPCRLFVRLDDQTYSIALPPPLDGRIMQLVLLEDPVIVALGDARSKLDLV